MQTDSSGTPGVNICDGQNQRDGQVQSNDQGQVGDQAPLAGQTCDTQVSSVEIDNVPGVPEVNMTPVPAPPPDDQNYPASTAVLFVGLDVLTAGAASALEGALEGAVATAGTIEAAEVAAKAIETVKVVEEGVAVTGIAMDLGGEKIIESVTHHDGVDACYDPSQSHGTDSSVADNASTTDHQSGIDVAPTEPHDNVADYDHDGF